MAYEFQQSDAEELASIQGWATKIKGDEMMVEYCPYCSSNSNDKWKFSINLKKGVYNCFRGSCARKGHFVQLARDMGFKIRSLDNTGYTLPKQTDLKIPAGAEKVYGKRGISKATIQKYKLQLSDKYPNTMVFPFIDENGVQVAFKCRKVDFDPSKDKMKEWFTPKNTKPILFGMHCATDYNSPLVITEGQLDALSLDTAGIKNAVSVPTGANGFSWVKYCRDWVNKFPEIIIFGDNDNAGMSMITNIQKHFKNKVIKVVPCESYLGMKDANDILTNCGADELSNACKSAVPRKIKEIKRLADIEYVDISKKSGVKTGIKKLDECIGKMYYGGVYILTGRRGEGKSTLASQILLNVIEQGCNCLIYSAELDVEDFKYKLVKQAKGLEHAEDNDDVINKWLGDKVYIYDQKEVWLMDDSEIRKSIESIEEAIITNGINFVLIDNLMMIMADYDSEKDYYRAQQKIVRKLKTLSVVHGITVLLVAHPKKDNDKKSDDLDNDSISGSGVIADIADSVLTYQKNEDEKTFKDFQAYLGVTKNRTFGKLLRGKNRITMKYSSTTCRVIQKGEKGDLVYSCYKEPDDDLVMDEVPF